MPAISRLSFAGAFAVLTLGALPVCAHERSETSDTPTMAASAKLHNLVLYTDARLAFYGSESARTGSCRDRAPDSEAQAEAAAHTEE